MISSIAAFTRERDGAIYVCTPLAGNCCCGNVDRDFAQIRWMRWIEAWCRHPISARVPLVPTKCLGACNCGNVVLVRASGQSFWLGGVEERHMASVFGFALRVLNGERERDATIRRLCFEPVVAVEDRVSGL